MILEEVCFKLIYAKASEVLDTRNIWKIRENLKLNREFRKKVFEMVKKFHEYVEYMFTKGLRIESVIYSDYVNSQKYIEKYGILPADAMHIAVALRAGAKTIATFDEDFKLTNEIKTTPI